MQAIELIGNVDERHCLRAEAPEHVPPGPVRLIVLLTDEDEGGLAWAPAVSPQWSDDLGDPRQDIYTLEDGQPVNASR